jgi:uncharacterized membrane protein
MNQQQFPSADVTSDDRLWALLAYIFTPIIPIVILLMPEKKERPFLKVHNIQALALGVVEVVVNIILSILSLGFLGCVVGLVFLAINIYFGVQANSGKIFEIPVITNFVRQQGWM